MPGLRQISEHKFSIVSKKYIHMQSCFLYFGILFLKTHKNSTRRSIRSYRRYAQITMTTSNVIASSQASLPTQKKSRGGGQDRSGDGSKIQDR